MQAVILAAGRGTRLKPAVNRSKCLVDIGGTTLLAYQLAMLRSLGINDICIVVGFCAGLVRAAVEGDCTFIENLRFDETNSLYSLCLARNWATRDLLICNCDVLAHPAVYERLLAAPTSALAFDSSSGHEAEHMKVCCAPAGQLHAIGKSLAAQQTHGENVGLIKIARADVRSFFADAEAVLAQNGLLEWAPAALGRFATHSTVRCIDIAGVPWCEIDYEEDVELARQVVWPQINASRQASASTAVGERWLP